MPCSDKPRPNPRNVSVKSVRADVLDEFPALSRSMFEPPVDLLRCPHGDDPEIEPEPKHGKPTGCGATTPAPRALLDAHAPFRRIVSEDDLARLTEPFLRGVDRSLPSVVTVVTARPCDCPAHKTKRLMGEPTEDFRKQHAAAMRATHNAVTRITSLTLSSGAPVMDPQVARVFELVRDPEKAHEVAARLVLKRAKEPITDVDAWIFTTLKNIDREAWRAMAKARKHAPITSYEDDGDDGDDDGAGLDPAAEYGEPMSLDPISVVRERLHPERTRLDWSARAAQLRAAGITAPTAYARALVEGVDRYVAEHPEDREVFEEVFVPSFIARSYMIAFDIPADAYQALRDTMKKALAKYRPRAA